MFISVISSNTVHPKIATLCPRKSRFVLPISRPNWKFFALKLLLLWAVSPSITFYHLKVLAEFMAKSERFLGRDLTSTSFPCIILQLDYATVACYASWNLTFLKLTHFFTRNP